jgi:hypothetical protein
MNKLLKFLDNTFLDLGRQFKWSYLPPLMVYVAAGISGLTGIVGTFFVKDYLKFISCVSCRIRILGRNSMGFKNAIRTFS